MRTEDVEKAVGCAGKGMGRRNCEHLLEDRPSLNSAFSRVHRRGDWQIIEEHPLQPRGCVG